ncbi:MAG: response regulator [Eubacteriales bacterium]|nr:response regulator [Eubacteriales bacterium]
MYRLVIVDDEQTIRNGMCHYIDWNSLGFEVVADFEDGKETLEYIKDHPVDVIMTDIEMAEVTGIELARHVWENHLPQKVVILSGYREFEYARKAIEYNVEHYLLKPIRLDELNEVFGKIKGELDKQQKEKQEKSNREKELQEILPELQEQFWTALLVGGLPYNEKVLHKKALLGLDFDADLPCAVVNVQMEIQESASQNYYQQRDNRYNLLNNIFASGSREFQFYPVYISADTLKVVVTNNEPIQREDFEKRLGAVLEEKKNAVAVLLTLKIEMQVEDIFANLSEMAKKCSTLQMHVKEESGEKVLLESQDQERLQQKYRLVMELIDDSDFEGLEEIIENLFFEFRKFPLSVLQKILVDLFSMLSRKFMKMGDDLWKAVSGRVDYQRILKAADVAEEKKVCLEMMQEINQIVKGHQNQVSRNVIDRTVIYMKEHFGEDISLEVLADSYYLNPTYFSRMFRQYMGVTFTDYLVELRMKEAKRLLLLGKFKVYEVSQKVGYKSDKYFCRVFKQYTGQSPTEFCQTRKQI